MGLWLITIAASIGNLLHGWDTAAIAGSTFYIKKEFNLENEPLTEGLVIAMSFIGAAVITTFSGALSDVVGRRPLLILSSLFYFVSGILMFWAHGIYSLLVSRFISGLGIGLVFTIVPMYISEIGPSDIRGLLNTIPQFTGCFGMFISYCIVFVMTLNANPNWKLILSFLSVPSVLYFIFTLFCIPESPRWLVSKGRIDEAKCILQKLRGKDDVSGEMALLVEGLIVGKDSIIQEYIIGPADELPEDDETKENEKLMLCGLDDGRAWVARPVKEQSVLNNSFIVPSNVPFLDPLVVLFGSVHEKLPEMGSMRSMLFPNFGSMFSVAGPPPATEEWDDENTQVEGEVVISEAERVEDNDNDDNDIHSPLISRQGTSVEDQQAEPTLVVRSDSVMQEPSRKGVGGGWHLAWKLSKDGGFKKMYFHQKSASGNLRQRGSSASLLEDEVQGSEVVQANALVGPTAVNFEENIEAQLVGPNTMVQPLDAAFTVVGWEDFFHSGVKRALFLGIGIQILQQFAGINGVLYYAPQIFKRAGIEDLLPDVGISPDSASILISTLIALLMLPSIGVAMRFMDISGRRGLLLATIPVLIVSLIALVIINLVHLSLITKAVLSAIIIIIYICFFVIGFGPTPNVLCAEIFPTRVRGLSISVCSLAMWIGGIIVTFTLPLLLSSIGVAGLFAVYGAVCVVSFLFVFLKVPETKSMPLEVIAEFFAYDAKEGN